MLVEQIVNEVNVYIEIAIWMPFLRWLIGKMFIDSSFNLRHVPQQQHCLAHHLGVDTMDPHTLIT